MPVKLKGLTSGSVIIKAPNTGSQDIEVTLPGSAGTLLSATSNAEIKTAYEANSDTNEFSDAEQTKLGTLQTHPTGDGNLHVPATSTSNNGKLLTAGSTAGAISWQDAPVSLPAQSSTTNKKFLTSDGSSASWAESSSTANPFYEHHAIVSIDHTITTNYNAVTVGPITLNTGKSITVPSGSTWVIL
jgi:hypothetical protein